MVQQVDVCIICALEEEANAVEEVMSERCQVTFLTHATGDGRFVYRSTTIVNTKGEPLSLVLFRQTRPGPVSAALDLGRLREKFQPSFLGMSGICAGDKRHLRLGDLVVAEHAYHFEEGKVTRDGQGIVIHQPEGITYSPPEHVLQHVCTFGAWKTPVVELKKRLFGTQELPRCVMTLMASGMAVRGDDPFPVLQKQHRKTWALDMEAASFYLVLCATPGLDGLVVKGVSDYADHCKDDAYRNFAARASAMYLLTFIQEHVTRETVRRSRSQTLPVSTLPYLRDILPSAFQTPFSHTLALQPFRPERSERPPYRWSAIIRGVVIALLLIGVMVTQGSSSARHTPILVSPVMDMPHLTLSESPPRTYYIGANGHVYELTGEPGQSDRDVTMASGNAPKASGSALTGFGLPTTFLRIYYIGANGHIYELAGKPGWSYQDITSASGNAPPAVAGSALTSFGISNGFPRVYYIGANNHIYELGWGSSWSYQDITSASGNAPPVGAGSALTSFALSGSLPHVCYTGTNGHIYELAWGPGWSHHDVTTDKVGGNQTASCQPSTSLPK